MPIKNLVDNFITQYIRDQWVNFRDALNAPQAREQVLSSGKLYFYEGQSNTLLYSFSDKECEIPMPNPVVADASGEFPDIFLKPGKPIRVELADRFDTKYVCAELDEELNNAD
jgi:hypothetical protein